MTLALSILNTVVRAIVRTICKVDDSDLAKIPPKGPLILVGNHVNFLDGPLVFSHLAPRPIQTLVKIETWDNFLIGGMFTIWRAIPIRRGEVDLTALQKAREALAEGNILLIAPEGTRSETGQLLRGRPGVILLAMRTNYPLQPVGFFGSDVLMDNLRHLRQTPFHFRVGNPFRLIPDVRSPSKEERQQIVDEIMYQIAALLPPKYRGVYSDLENATENFLAFEPGVTSNLQIARTAEG